MPEAGRESSSAAAATKAQAPRPRLLDLFCCQGGAARGYADAGFEVVGVDLQAQPRYPFEFHRGDALVLFETVASDIDGYVFAPPVHWQDFDAIHASPPCQAHTNCQRIRANEHPELVDRTRYLLARTGLPYVIENVVGAPLRDPVLLCGAMFPGLHTYRHRLFETNWPLPQPAHPEHVAKQVKMGRAPRPGEWLQIVGNFSGVDLARRVMRMPWATREGLREAIPPAYTEHIGRELVEHLRILELSEQAA